MTGEEPNGIQEVGSSTPFGSTLHLPALRQVTVVKPWILGIALLANSFAATPASVAVLCRKGTARG